MHTGERIAERFTIIRPAGQGGMSEVYLARDQQTNQDVALKLLSVQDEQNYRRFQLEATALASLVHPAIVRCLAHGETAEGRPYLALEWLEGEELAARLDRGPLSIEEALDFLQRTAEALEVVHSKGIVHRDLKPQNIFLPGRSLPALKLLDFGIAHHQDATRGLTRTGTIIGTLNYMSPEQASEGTIELDTASDIFSLGCVAFECLAGRLAFQGDTVAAVLAKILFSELPSVKSLRSDVPQELSDLIAQMTHKDPAKRPQNGAALSLLVRGLRLPPEAQTAVIQVRRSPLTVDEQRLFCVLMIRTSLEGAALPSEAAPTPESAAPGEFIAVRRDAPSLPSKSLANLRAIASRYGGRVEALSDGALVVVISGAGVASDQAIKSVRCALALRSLLPGARMSLAIERSQAGRPDSAIDEAARLLPETGDDGVWLDAGIAGLADARFSIERLGERFLLRKSEELREGRTLLGRPSPYLGRDSELSWLAEILEYCAKTSKASCALITAEAGIGKSRLAHEALRTLAPKNKFEVWSAYGDPLRAGAPFGLLSQLLRRVFAMQDGEPLELRQQKLLQQISKSLSKVRRRRADLVKRPTGAASPPHEEATRLAAFLGEISGAPFSDADSAFLRAARQDTRLMNDQLQAAFLDWLFIELQQRPLFLLLDDLHWGDLPSISFLDAALRELNGSPLMVLALARPEVKEVFPGIWQKRGLEELTLSPLSPRMSEKVVRGVLGEDTPPEQIKRLVEHAGGNAFYLEELLRAVVEGRTQELPETVLAMSQARLEALPRDARLVLRAASIFGQRCWQSALLTLLGETLDPAALSRCLRELCQQEVLFSDGEGAFPAEEEFSFRHPLLREAAYSMLTKEDKARGHLLAGEWLSKAGEPNAAVLAEHFERGGDSVRAVEFYIKAAEQALAGDDLEAALSRAEKGLLLGPTGEQRGALRLLQIDPLLWRNAHETAEACALEAMSVLPKTSKLWYRAAAYILTVSTHLGHLEHFVALIDALREQTPSAEARTAYITDTSMLVPYLSFAGMYDVAELFVKKVEDASAEIADSDPIAKAWLCTARSYRATLLQGDPWGFFSNLREAVQCFSSAGDSRNEQLTYVNQGIAAKFLGSFEESAYMLRRSIADSERIGLRLVSASANHYLMLTLVLSGELGEEFEALKKSVEAFVASDTSPLAGTSRHSLAQVHLLRGDLEAAEREGRAAAEALWVAPPARSHALATLSMILLQQNKLEEALSTATEAMEGLLSLGAIGEGEGQVMLALFDAQRASGNHSAAKTTLLRAKRRLLERAEKIEELRYRDLFMLVPENARVMQLTQELLS